MVRKERKDEFLRVFLIIFSFVNAVFYVLIYSYFDKVVEIVGGTGLSPVTLNYMKLASLMIAGFCIGVIVMLLLKLKLKRSFFSFKNLVIVGIFPLVCLILSEGTITGFIISRFFNSSEELSELAFYLFSRQSIWALWLGFATGSSIRFSFSRRKYKHISVETKPDKSPEFIKEADKGKQGHNHFPE